MRAVILAAGEGSRMRPLTHTVPKPLTVVAGKPILEWIIESVAEHVDGIVLIVGHLREKIEAHFGRRWRGLDFDYVHQTEQHGTGHALQICREALEGEERFFVIYGDNISAPLDMARCAEHPLSALAIRVPDPEKYGIFRTDADGNMIDLIEKPTEFVGDLANAGVYIFDQRIFEELDRTPVSERGEIELTDAVLTLAKRAPMRVVEVEGHWLPIGYRDDVAKAEPVLLDRERGAGEMLAQRRRTILALLGFARRNLLVLLAKLTDRPNLLTQSSVSDGRSILDLLRHIVVTDSLVRGLATGNEWPDLPQTSLITDLDSAREILATERDATVTLIGQLSEDKMDLVVTVPLFVSGEDTHMTIEEVLLSLGQHEAWHTGQIALTLSSKEERDNG